jgi:hypothetical protein
MHLPNRREPRGPLAVARSAEIKGGRIFELWGLPVVTRLAKSYIYFFACIYNPKARSKSLELRQNFQNYVPEASCTLAASSPEPAARCAPAKTIRPEMKAQNINVTET